MDDASSDDTVAVARAAGARVLELGAGRGAGNPALGRNRGAAMPRAIRSSFSTPTARPPQDWLGRLLGAHERRRGRRGRLARPPTRPPGDGALRLLLRLVPRALPAPGRRGAEPSPGQPERPPRRVRADAADSPSGSRWPTPTRSWPGRRRFGAPEAASCSSPRAVVYHHNRPGFGNLLRRNYRWGYSAIESKAQTGAARQAWVYRYPGLLVVGSLPLALGSTAYILGCWLRARAVEPLLMLPAVLAARLAYSAGLVAGGIRWIRHGEAAAPDAAALGMSRHAGSPRRSAPGTGPACSQRALESLAAPDPRRRLRSWWWTTPRPTARPARWSAPGFPSVRYVVEPVPGLDFARNRALADALARGRRLPRRRRGGRARTGPTRCTRVFETDASAWRSAPGGSSRSRWRLRASGSSRPTAGSPAAPSGSCLPDDADRPLHGRPAPLIAWAISVGMRLQLRRAPRRRAARSAGSTRRSTWGCRCRAAATTTCSGGRSSAGTRWCTSRRRSRGTSTAAKSAAAHDQIVGHQRAVAGVPGQASGGRTRRARPALARLHRVAAGQARRAPAATRAGPGSAAGPACCSGCGGTAGWD